MPPRRRSDLVIPRETSAEESQYTLRVPDAEYLLLQHLTELKVDSVLCTSLGRGQLAAHLADLAPKAKVTCFFFDQYLADDTIDYHAGKHPRLQIVCGADLPDRKVELAALPVTKGGEAELTREVLHQMHDRLFRGGMLVAGVDNPTDTWLYHELEKIFRSIQRIPERRGIIYRCIKEEEIKRPRDPRCEFAFRDQGNLIKAVSRPGVFSHRHLDLGSKGTIVQTSDDHLVVTLGLEDMLVVHTPDATLVADRSREEEVKQVVAERPQESPLGARSFRRRRNTRAGR